VGGDIELRTNLGRVADILQHGAVNRGEGASARAALARAKAGVLLAEDGALSDEEDVLAAELLLQLADQSICE
jgi:multidrug resistance efflux pump